MSMYSDYDGLVDPVFAQNIHTIEKYCNKIYYSEKYEDDFYQYRHIILPKEIFNIVKSSKKEKKVLTEKEWRTLGVQGSLGWQHYAVHDPEPHILLFRRTLEMARDQEKR
eukprot:TRINITY_DN2152_c0_g1_i1.p3 TRINITY_DN2152_c0_g1~~TRINITY_DN2152_c0_g1_i1.p3  ORF type:complete len:110 (-),score=46.26 TRINITY_DN2152_c0_g1_i1:145-474(-)